MAKPTLLPNERELGSHRANRTQGSRAVGGHLLLTDQRLLFAPHLVDSATGGRAWECQLSSITNVGLAPRGSNPFNGSMRRRLQVDTADGTEYFVLNKAERIADAIRLAADA